MWNIWVFIYFHISVFILIYIHCIDDFDGSTSSNVLLIKDNCMENTLHTPLYTRLKANYLMLIANVTVTKH